MFDVVTFGEAMIRLVPPHFQRLEQTTSLDVQVGGGELNVAVGVSRLGLRSTWVSRLPKNALGRLLENRARQAGVDMQVGRPVPALDLRRHQLPGLDQLGQSGPGFRNPDAEVVGQVGGRAHPVGGRGVGEEAAVSLLDGRRRQSQHLRGEHPLGQDDRGAPHLVFDWSPDGTLDALADVVARLSAEVSGPVDSALCPHAAGPPTCWCRPPLPGLPLAFARAHGVDLSRSILVGTGPAHRTLATALGARYVPVC